LAAGRRELIELAGPGQRVIEVGLRHGSGHQVSEVLYFRDVTSETVVDRMKSEFLSTAAHELRTPMATIYGYAEILQVVEFEAEERKAYLGNIFRQAQLMASIINELLDLARIEARRGKDFDLRPMDIGALAVGVARDYKPPQDREPPEIAAPDDLLTVRADTSKMHQVIGNVLSNAYKYSPGGGPVSLVFIRDASHGALWHGVRIRDRGIGMTPAETARVCERFFRADTSGKIPGTGLGMSIVKEIMELHGGRVEIASEPGAGTEVTLWLPALDDRIVSRDTPAPPTLSESKQSLPT
jgi:signal transduction histidine kinase